MDVTIITPHEQRTIGLEWLEVHTPRGSMIIQKGHAPLISTLKPGSTILMHDLAGEQLTFEVIQGLIEVTKERVMVILYQK